MVVNKTAHSLIADTLAKYITQKPSGITQKKWYYENGNISIKASYLNGIKEGETTYYWPDGSISKKVIFKKGIEQK